ncbi:Rrf2 family transcriptional regulator [Corynebacterium bovis]|uniref:Rrf2 family transcriptional regulator n=1 Tax=Corynebacterium bovis TaxID=36808 RepID=A0A3R8PGU4_9CORY|nr:Rrf2 family transcriptional regulator [Corynebacterium bovis]RRO91938.1 Rrf2 family transcriptional regulator [Corynebacterium bovis]RRQ01851.1 Rrf2 family transcriptional regulator [Corynebacterium bovis]RRQ05100.1 Rrf2 family transcriptional regulator [Corynebacterium bovis]RRQ05662.1 Rrf2 family transcriptional regulator [Corynebacterium bovis]RRQ11840.1 Rrf2 family transcriptional regulator [Corynebacterium bovis]
MHLTTFADLGLRSLMLMSGRRSTVGRIAVLANASPSHVKKVVARLVDLGVAESVRGRGGGVSLAEGALRTDVGWLLRELEGPGEVVRCGGGCPLADRGCALRHRLPEARANFFATFDGQTVGDLVAGTAGLPIHPPTLTKD